MTPFAVIAEMLQAIPPKFRKGLLYAFVLVVVAQVIIEDILGHDTGKLSEVLLYVGGYLGVQSAANVGPVEPLEVAVVPPCDPRCGPDEHVPGCPNDNQE